MWVVQTERRRTQVRFKTFFSSILLPALTLDLIFFSLFHSFFLSRTDADGIPDYLDPDSDNDGLADSIEKGTPTAGTLKGTSFTAHDFTGDNQNLIVVVDGGTPQTIAVVANCDTLVNCAAALSPLMNGATVTVEGSNLKITSDTTGLSSTIAITATGSGVNALALFGPNPVVVNGDVVVDTDGDGTPDFLDPKDSDGDGIPDHVEIGSNPNNPNDTDGDLTPDYQDLDRCAKELSFLFSSV